MAILDLLPAIVAPLGALVVWQYKRYYKHIDKINSILIELDKKQAITDVKLETIQGDIDEIKDGVSKLVDKYHYRTGSK